MIIIVNGKSFYEKKYEHENDFEKDIVNLSSKFFSKDTI